VIKTQALPKNTTLRLINSCFVLHHLFLNDVIVFIEGLHNSFLLTCSSREWHCDLLHQIYQQNRRIDRRKIAQWPRVEKHWKSANFREFETW